MVEAKLYAPLLGLGDKFLHFIGYCGLAFLAILSFHRRNRGVAAALSMILLGVGVEFAQMLSPTRTTEWADATANTAGVLCGLMAALLLRLQYADRSAPVPIQRYGAGVAACGRNRARRA
jgi:VanZ family protein